jgi:hypothetical protein
VSRLGSQWKSGRILSLNLFLDEVNKQVAGDFKVRRTPTYILFDRDGREVKRWVSEQPRVEELPRE